MSVIVFPLINTNTEPRLEKMGLRTYANGKLQASLCISAVSPEPLLFVLSYIKVYCLRKQTAKLQERLYGCAGSPEALLLAYVRRPIFSRRGLWPGWKCMPTLSAILFPHYQISCWIKHKQDSLTNYAKHLSTPSTIRKNYAPTYCSAFREEAVKMAAKVDMNLFECFFLSVALSNVELRDVICIIKRHLQYVISIKRT